MILRQRLHVGFFQSPEYGKDRYHYADDHVVPHRYAEVSVVERKRRQNKPEAQNEIHPAQTFHLFLTSFLLTWVTRPSLHG